MSKWFPQLICLSILAYVSRCEDVNTRLDWPSGYEGFWAMLGFLVAVALLAGAIRLAAATAKQTNNNREAVAGIVVLLFLASLVLQFLPSSDSGIQIIPRSPWAYVGWLSFFLSVAVWLLVIYSVLVASINSPDSASIFSAVLLIAMFGNLLLSFSECKEPTIAQVAISEPHWSDLKSGVPHKSEIENWKSKSSRLRNVLQGLFEERDRLERQMSRMSNAPGYQSVKQELAIEQQELTEQIELARSELLLIESNILQAESRMRRLDRHTSINEASSVSNGEFEDMSRFQHELEEELRSFTSQPYSASLLKGERR